MGFVSWLSLMSFWGARLFWRPDVTIISRSFAATALTCLVPRLYTVADRNERNPWGFVPHFVCITHGTMQGVGTSKELLFPVFLRSRATLRLRGRAMHGVRDSSRLG